MEQVSKKLDAIIRNIEIASLRRKALTPFLCAALVVFGYYLGQTSTVPFWKVAVANLIAAALVSLPYFAKWQLARMGK
jgi:hypothetical protein